MNRIMFLNGKFVEEKDAVIPVTTHALHYGTACFEGIRAYYNHDQNALFVFRMEDHYKRLIQSCRILFISIPYSLKELSDITTELLKKNFQETDLYIRPLAFKSDPAIGNFNLKKLNDSFLVYTTPLGRHLDTEKGIRANISSWTRISDNTIPPRAKISGSYVNTTLAKTDSFLAGYDEALLLDKHGHIVEGSAENVFIVKNGEVITPPVSDDILHGITRDTVMAICKNKLEIDVKERSIDRSEIYQTDEVFLVGTGAEISPVVEIDGRKIGNGGVGIISKKIKEIYYKMVHGEIEQYNNFLVKIEK